jgi:hypothetical protein
MSPKNPISFLGIPEFLVVGFLSLFLAASGARAQVQFSGPTDYPVGTAPATAAVGDFNGDDKPGIIPQGEERTFSNRERRGVGLLVTNQLGWIAQRPGRSGGEDYQTAG